MKTISKLIITAVLALAAAACTLDVDNTETPDGREEITQFKVASEGTTATKIYVGGGLNLFFNEGDLFTVFNKNKYNKKFVFNGGNGDATGVLTKVSNGSGSNDQVDHSYAVYPYNSSAEMRFYEDNNNQYGGDFYYIITELPDEQFYELNSFGIGANLMLAVTDDDHLEFKNVCGFLKLLLYGDNVSVKRITIKGNKKEKIAGQANISMQNGQPDINPKTLTKKEISIVCDPPVLLGTKATSPTEFWFVIPPTKFSEGFTITVTDTDDDSFTKTTSNGLEVKRNRLEGMSALEVVIPKETPSPGAIRTIYLAGDSHVAPAASKRPRYGWGEKLAAALSALPGVELVPNVVNAAQGGRTSADFKDATHHRWQTYIAPYLAAGDLVLIEFGPNDYRPANNVSLSQYATNLTWYINQTRAKGAFPVLVTPPNTCTFEADNWTVIESFWSAYSDKMRQVAVDTNTPLVDVEDMSQTWLHNMGYTAALPYYMRSSDPDDLGHLKDPGATLVAGWVAQGLCDLGYWY